MKPSGSDEAVPLNWTHAPTAGLGGVTMKEAVGGWFTGPTLIERVSESVAPRLSMTVRVTGGGRKRGHGRLVRWAGRDQGHVEGRVGEDGHVLRPRLVAGLAQGHLVRADGDVDRARRVADERSGQGDRGRARRGVEGQGLVGGRGPGHDLEARPVARPGRYWNKPENLNLELALERIRAIR